jgi:hypothetical protein
VDGLSDIACPGVSVEERRTPDGPEREFGGFLCGGAGDPSTVGFQTVYRYTPYRILRRVPLTFPAGFAASAVVPLDMALDGRVDAYAPKIIRMDVPSPIEKSEAVLGTSARLEIVSIPRRKGVFMEHPHPPVPMSRLRLGGEGIQAVPCGDLSAWDRPTGQTDRGRAWIANERGGARLRYDVVSADPPAVLPRELEFAVMLRLVNLPAVRPAPLPTVMVGNPPFPVDGILSAWADSGVELICVMEGAAWFDTGAAGTDRFWPINSYPGYRDEADMRDMDRMVRSARRWGIRVIMYTYPVEIHPEAPAFGAHIKE